MISLLPTVEADAPAPQGWADILRTGAAAWIDGAVERKYRPREPTLYTFGPGNTLQPVGTSGGGAYLVGNAANVTGYQSAGGGALAPSSATLVTVLVLGALALGAFLILRD